MFKRTNDYYEIGPIVELRSSLGLGKGSKGLQLQAIKGPKSEPQTKAHEAVALHNADMLDPIWQLLLRS